MTALQSLASFLHDNLTQGQCIGPSVLFFIFMLSNTPFARYNFDYWWSVQTAYCLKHKKQK
jgi:hypothetical protein